MMRQKRCTACVAAGPMAQRVKRARSRRSSLCRNEGEESTGPKLGRIAGFCERIQKIRGTHFANSGVVFPREGPHVTRSKKRGASEPPELPTLERRLRFGGWQIVGLALTMSIPVLAVFGVFGETRATTTERGSQLALSLNYPSRIRHGALDAFSVSVTNNGPVALDTVEVAFDSAYVTRFTEPQFIPGASRAFVVELTDLAAGETRLVNGGLRANVYGRHRGRVVASHAIDTVTASMSTIVFP